MGEFIRVNIDPERCLGAKECGKCIQVCPVNIFAPRGADCPHALDENEDECTLCDLCLTECETNAITIHKLYEE